MASRQTVETTFADLRESDLVIDKSGQAWPIEEIEESLDGLRQEFWLCDPVSKIRIHKIIKPQVDPVKVSRLPTQADEAAKLEADFPKSSAPTSDGGVGTTKTTPTIGTTTTSDSAPTSLPSGGDVVTAEADFPKSESQPPTMSAGQDAQLTGSAEVSEATTTVEDAVAAEAGVEEVDMNDAVAAVEQLLGGEIEAEVTAAEVDAANAATEDSQVSLPAFVDMTILEMRSHLYLLHGVYAHDLKSRAETMTMHDQAHVDQEAGRLQSAYVPHVHDGSERSEK